MAFTRITIDHRVMGGLPCIAGTRIPVAMLVRMIAAGTSERQILDEYTPRWPKRTSLRRSRFAAANLDRRVSPLTA